MPTASSSVNSVTTFSVSPKAGKNSSAPSIEVGTPMATQTAIRKSKTSERNRNTSAKPRRPAPITVRNCAPVSAVLSSQTNTLAPAGGS